MTEIHEIREIKNPDGSPSGRYRMTWRSDEMEGSLRGCCECAGSSAACPGHESPGAANEAFLATSQHWSVKQHRALEAEKERRGRLRTLISELRAKVGPDDEMVRMLEEEAKGW